MIIRFKLSTLHSYEAPQNISVMCVDDWLDGATNGMVRRNRCFVTARWTDTVAGSYGALHNANRNIKYLRRVINSDRPLNC